MVTLFCVLAVAFWRMLAAVFGGHRTRADWSDKEKAYKDFERKHWLPMKVYDLTRWGSNK